MITKKSTDYSGLKYYFVHPVMLALYVFIIFLVFAPDYFHEYKAEIVETEILNNNSKLYFHDLNGDRISEAIKTLVNRGGETPAITFFDKDNNIINQWNLRGNWLIDKQIYFGDYNNNGFDEVYCITRVGDSLFLNVNELMLASGLKIKNKFICQTKLYNIDNDDVFVVDGIVMDSNGDGFDEFVFTLFSGFSNQPRNTFAYDIASDSFVKSALSASGFIRRISFMDINGDGIYEITGNINAVNNIHYDLPYTDSCSWLMVINPADSLDFLFPPIRFDGVFGGLMPVFYTIKNKNYIVSTYSCKSVGNSTDGILLQIFDCKGKLLNKKLLPYNKYGNLTLINPFNGNENNIYLINKYGEVYISDTSLNIHHFCNSNIDGSVINLDKLVSMDIDNDGKKEMIFISSRPIPNKLVIYRSSLEECTIIDLPESKSTIDWHITLNQKVANELPIINLQAENVLYYLKYSKSKYYLLRFPSYILVFIILYLLFCLLQKGQNKLAERKFESEKLLMKQQMALSKRQLEPHFMLNTLNNIGFMFANENKDEAQYYFGKFASLIHRGLKYADKTETTLFEELEFVKDFLILQERRFNDDFQFNIHTDENIELKSILITHSIVYTFVENSIKHGLWNKDGDKNLEIRITKENQKTFINITDNGVGRQKSKFLKTHGTGKGLKILSSIVESYNKLNGRDISFKIDDLVNDNGDALGTNVTIIV